jgi:hypothetical protein
MQFQCIAKAKYARIKIKVWTGVRAPAHTFLFLINKMPIFKRCLKTFFYNIEMLIRAFCGVFGFFLSKVKPAIILMKIFPTAIFKQ